MSGQQHAPAALYPRERPSTHFTGGWVGPRASPDGRKISSPPAFDPGPSSPRSVAKPTELPGPLLKHIGAINKEQYNELSINCAFVCLLYINAYLFTVTVKKSFQLIPLFLIIRLMAMNCHLQASQQILPIHQLTQGFQTYLLLLHRPVFHSTPSRVWNHRQMQLCLSSHHWHHTLEVILMMMLAPVLVHRSVLGVTLVLSLLMRIEYQLM